MHNRNEGKLGADKKTMIRISLTIVAVSSALIGAIDSMNPPLAFAYTIKGALCELMILDPLSPSEDFICDFTNHMGDAKIMSERRNFNFPQAEQGKTYRKQDFGEFFRFVVDGKYALTVYPSGEMPDEPGGF